MTHESDFFMTKDQFVDFWCKNAGITPEQLKEWEIEPIPCPCGKETCKGWMMQQAGKKGPVYLKKLEAVK